MQLLIISAGTALLILATLVLATDTRPTRAECIAGAELLWTGKEIDRVQILNKIGDLFAITRDYPVGGQGIRERERIYIIFTKNCANKNQMMAHIMTMYKQNISNFPEFKILEGPIEPSTDTVQVYGDEWSDGEMPVQTMD